MNAIHSAMQSVRLLAGFATPGQLARVRLQDTKSACWKIAIQIRNIAVVFGCGLALPIVGQVVYSCYSLAPPGRFDHEDYEFRKALSVGTAFLCTIAFLPKSLRTIKRSVLRIYDPVGARRAICYHRLFNFIKDALRMVGMIAMLALPGLFSWQVVQVILVSAPAALTQQAAKRLNEVATLLIEMK